MITNQQYFTKQIENIANEQGYSVFETLNYSNTGIWVFRKGNIAKRLYFMFDTNHGDIRLENSNMSKGAYFEYGNTREENKMYEFVLNFLG